jgi:hypothetical protein
MYKQVVWVDQNRVAGSCGDQETVICGTGYVRRAERIGIYGELTQRQPRRTVLARFHLVGSNWFGQPCERYL